MNEHLVAVLFEQLMTEGLGFDLTNPNLTETPLRVAKMFCREFFPNCNTEFKDFKAFPNTYNYDQIIVSDRIFFVSTCSHHFLPFVGHAWLLYIPKHKLIGASKCSRLINHYAGRPQLQENLGHEVMNAFNKSIEPRGTMIVMRAVHQCMKCRGAKQYGGAGMTTSCVSGYFYEDPTVKQEGFDLIKLSLMDKE